MMDIFVPEIHPALIPVLIMLAGMGFPVAFLYLYYMGLCAFYVICDGEDEDIIRQLDQDLSKCDRHLKTEIIVIVMRMRKSLHLLCDKFESTDSDPCTKFEDHTDSDLYW